MISKAAAGPALAAALTLLAGGPALAGEADDTATLRQRIERLEQQLRGMEQIAKELREMKAQLAATEKRARAAESSAKAAERTAKVARNEAAADDGADIRWHLGGYGTAEYTHTDAAGAQDEFGASFNPIFLIAWRDLLLFEGELEVLAQTDGSTKTALEFANLNLNARDWLTFTAGKFLSPLGDFQQHQHPAWINKLPDRPAGFVEDGGAEPLSEVGVMARGAVPLGSMTADYAVYVGNGPRLAEEADEGVLLEGFGGDNNDNKAFGGRVGLRPLPYVSVGLSGMVATVDGNPGTGGPVTDADYTLVGADAAFTRGAWDIRGEYFLAHMDGLSTALAPDEASAPIGGTTWRAGFAQAAYRLSGVTENRWLGRLEPVVRYSRFTVSGIDEFRSLTEDRWTLGLNYWFTPSAVLKAAYENRDMHTQPDDDVFRIQFAFGF